MYAVFIILNNIDKLEDISKVFYDHACGATTIDSEGLGNVLFQNNIDVSIFAGIRKLVEGNKPYNKTIISIIEGQEKLRTIVDILSKEFIDKPGTGVMFVLPVLECYGIKNDEYINH